MTHILARLVRNVARLTVAATLLLAVGATSLVLAGLASAKTTPGSSAGFSGNGYAIGTALSLHRGKAHHHHHHHHKSHTAARHH